MKTIFFFYHCEKVVDCDSSKLYLSMRYVWCVQLLRYIISVTVGSRSNIDQTWWKCWNLDPIDCIRISYRFSLRMDSKVGGYHTVKPKFHVTE